MNAQSFACRAYRKSCLLAQAVTMSSALCASGYAQGTPPEPRTPNQLEYIGSTKPPAPPGISRMIAVPADRAYVWLSGNAAEIADPSSAPGSRERYGDTKAQAISILKDWEVQLRPLGLSLKDVIYLRAYITPDKLKDNETDFAGWFEAYAELFTNVPGSPRVSRATVGINRLSNPDWLIEIEAVVVYPKQP